MPMSLLGSGGVQHRQSAILCTHRQRQGWRGGTPDTLSRKLLAVSGVDGIIPMAFVPISAVRVGICLISLVRPRHRLLKVTDPHGDALVAGDASLLHAIHQLRHYYYRNPLSPCAAGIFITFTVMSLPIPNARTPTAVIAYSARRSSLTRCTGNRIDIASS